MDLVVAVHHMQEPVDRAGDVLIRKPLAYERHLVIDYIRETFGQKWASEATVTLSVQPISCFIAERAGKIVGFACFDATFRGMFGPTGVSEQARGKGVGKLLLLHCLHAMKHVGYAYAVIGGVESALGFYESVVGAQQIMGSERGPYVYSLNG